MHFFIFKSSYTKKNYLWSFGQYKQTEFQLQGMYEHKGSELQGCP